MIPLQDDTLSWILRALLAGALAAVGGRLLGGPWTRVGAWAGALASALALVGAVDAALAIARVGSFRYFDAGGWVGARLAGDLWPTAAGGGVPLALEPATAPLLIVVAGGGVAVAFALAAQRAAGAVASALLLQAAVVAVVLADRPAHLLAAFALAGGVATLAPLGAGASLVDGRAALRAFALHRAGDAALLGGAWALAASLGDDVWTTWAPVFEGAPLRDPWARLHGGLADGLPHRTLWFLAGGGVAVAAATRMGLGCWPLQRDLTTSTRLAPPLVGAIHGLGLYAPAVVLLVRLRATLALAPEAMDGLAFVATATLCVAGVLALAARDLLRLDALLLPAFAAVVAVLAGCGDDTGVVLGGLLLVTAGVTLPWAAALVVQATGERDPVALGGLEPRLPRTHSTRLLATAGLALPPFAGWVVVERALEATALSTRMPAVVVAALAAGAVLAALAAWRALHRMFNGAPVKTERDQGAGEPGAVAQAGALLLAFAAPGLCLLAIPRGLLLLLSLEVTYSPPLQAFCAPSWQQTAAVRALYAATTAPPPLSPSTFALTAAGAGLFPWALSWVFFRAARSGRPPPGRSVLDARPVAALAARLSAWAGRDVGVVRSVSEGVEALSRLLAVNFVPAALDLLLQRLPALVAAAGALVVRGTQTGVAPHALVLAFVIAAWLAWQAAGGAP
ncbi:MAG: hypothetical protein FJ137_10185 [Deltaproteobacteria bacterium]|nr:hypothetical protein [Deltaproteobacteria bacterium]